LICFLWEYSPGLGFTAQPPSLWSLIILSGWLPRTITITSVVLRSVISIQAAASMSIVASLSLERSGIPVEHVPLLLKARGFGSSRYELTGFCIRSIKESSRLQYVAVIVALMVTTFLSQLTSTFLLGDLENTLVLNGTTSELLGVGFTPADGVSRIDSTRGVEYWKSRIPEYPIFVEYSKVPVTSLNWTVDTVFPLGTQLAEHASAATAVLRYFWIHGLFALLLNFSLISQSPRNMTCTSAGWWRRICRV